MKQDDKPGYVVERSSIQTCCCQQVQATYLKRDGPPHRFYSVLLRMGFTYALFVTNEAVVSYTALPPLPTCVGGIFLLHFPWSRLHRTLSGILPYEAQTFLSCGFSALAAATVCLTSNFCNFNTFYIVCKVKLFCNNIIQ